jgi:hypothetical protein
VSAPTRIQLRRTKGWRKPANAVVVARPSIWGNPHRVDELGRDEAVRRYRDDLLAGRLGVSVDDVRRELRGRDLACWCRPEQPCHADVLLEVANT